MLKSQLCKRVSSGQLGMTLLELLVAIIMLVVFTGVVALVMQFTNGKSNHDKPTPRHGEIFGAVSHNSGTE